MPLPAAAMLELPSLSPGLFSEAMPPLPYQGMSLTLSCSLPCAHLAPEPGLSGRCESCPVPSGSW